MKTEKLTCPYCEKEFERTISIYEWTKQKLEEKISEPHYYQRRKLILDTLCPTCLETWKKEMSKGKCTECNKVVDDAYRLTNIGEAWETWNLDCGRCLQCVELRKIKMENEELKKKLEDAAPIKSRSSKTWW